MHFLFNLEKNELLKEKRKIGFEQIVSSIANGGVTEIEAHYNTEKYPNQGIFYVEIEKEIYVVPFVIEDEETVFLKTFFPSRKARKRFLEK